ncbi:MarR family transcriptional regulator [Nocardiopsis sp. TSRI0078]|uniref:MarR family winged helix-turn-helix transcriptional regulator n=1 Tax=unclassified Nocardiopsis TaxID=2649073 RepID=UPI00093F2996|nr:MarR family transcriptional regulator [Nocardiopsis sp. TSRI0078]OKI23503.1 MarR family transcriptional regulator [Nocardiopsis sp. TSRI0078]
MNDAVDVFLDQWARERPDLDTAPMGVLGRLSRASRLLSRGVGAYFSEQGLESWEFDVLATLRRAGHPRRLTPKELVAMTMVGSAAMTHRVDRLVGRGLVTREVDPGNRRRTLVGLTPEGLALVDRVVEGHVANQLRLLGGLEEGEREQLAALLRKLLLSLGDTPAEEPGG